MSTLEQAQSICSSGSTHSGEGTGRSSGERGWGREHSFRSPHPAPRPLRPTGPPSGTESEVLGLQNKNGRPRQARSEYKKALEDGNVLVSNRNTRVNQKTAGGS